MLTLPTSTQPLRTRSELQLLFSRDQRLSEAHFTALIQALLNKEDDQFHGAWNRGTYSLDAVVFYDGHLWKAISSEYDLQLVSVSLGIVAEVETTYHERIFDRAGTQVSDREDFLSNQSFQSLRQALQAAQCAPSLNKQIKSDLVQQIATSIDYPTRTKICSDEAPSLDSADWMSETASQLDKVKRDLEKIQAALGQCKQGLAFLTLGFVAIVAWWLLAGVFHWLTQVWG
mgnify:CR=1 FL=1